MNITYLIGNGFDLQLGYKTKYTDFNKYYIDKYPEDLLAKEIKTRFKDWADLEYALGEFCKKYKGDEGEFIQSKNNMDNALGEYMMQEMKRRLVFESGAATEFRDKIVKVDETLPIKEGSRYRNTTGGASEVIQYQFVTYNYTDSLDAILEFTRKQLRPFNTHKCKDTIYEDRLIGPVHVHGTMTSDLILGVNDRDQVSVTKDVSEDLALAMVKPEINDNLGNDNNETTEAIIDQSKYIIVFGMSVGYTDIKWWKYIYNWLKKDASNRLILCEYISGGRVASGGQTAQRKSKKKRDFFEKVGADQAEYEKYRDQIIVVINSPTFTFKKIHLSR